MIATVAMTEDGGGLQMRAYTTVYTFHQLSFLRRWRQGHALQTSAEADQGDHFLWQDRCFKTNFKDSQIEEVKKLKVLRVNTMLLYGSSHSRAQIMFQLFTLLFL